jgi:hypothetical protein
VQYFVEICSLRFADKSYKNIADLRFANFKKSLLAHLCLIPIIYVFCYVCKIYSYHVNIGKVGM